MSAAVIVTAKGSNSSLPGKNLLEIGGKPCCRHGIDAGLDAKEVDRVFMYSDGEAINEVALAAGATPLRREPVTFETERNHGEDIADAVHQVKEGYLPDLDIVTVLLGNTVYVTPELIDLSVRLLKRDETLDSVMSVWQAQDDHPYRALSINGDGILESFLKVESGTKRQSYPPVYYYDQGVWTFRVSALDARGGPNPWWWMGKRSFPIVRNWVTGRDTHTALDVAYSRYWLENGHADEILNLEEIEKRLS